MNKKGSSASSTLCSPSYRARAIAYSKNYVKKWHVWAWGIKNTHTPSIGAQTKKIQVMIDGLSALIIWSRGVSLVAIDICKLMKTY